MGNSPRKLGQAPEEEEDFLCPKGGRRPGVKMGARVIGSLRPGPLSGRCGLHVCVRLPEIHRTRHDCGGIEKAPFLLG